MAMPPLGRPDSSPPNVTVTTGERLEGPSNGTNVAEETFAGPPNGTIAPEEQREGSRNAMAAGNGAFVRGNVRDRPEWLARCAKARRRPRWRRATAILLE